MRPMDQVLVLSTRPLHVVICAVLFAAFVYTLITITDDAFRAVVSVYLAWRVTRWVLLTRPTT